MAMSSIVGPYNQNLTASCRFRNVPKCAGTVQKCVLILSPIRVHMAMGDPRSKGCNKMQCIGLLHPSPRMYVKRFVVTTDSRPSHFGMPTRRRRERMCPCIGHKYAGLNLIAPALTNMREVLKLVDPFVGIERRTKRKQSI